MCIRNHAYALYFADDNRMEGMRDVGQLICALEEMPESAGAEAIAFHMDGADCVEEAALLEAHVRGMVRRIDGNA